MSWDQEPLWIKSKLFFERAFEESKDDPMFGLWAALGLELLARSAVAAISPTLLAEPDSEQRNLLYALGRASERSPKKSISAAQVLSLCKQLFETFGEDDRKACSALINTRNEELHTGAAAFEIYKTTEWLANFYRCCNLLSTAQGRTLQDLFGADEATAAEGILKRRSEEVRGQVESKVAVLRRVFNEKEAEERRALASQAEKEAAKLAWHGFHRVQCPACGSSATVKGEVYGQEAVTHEAGEIVVRQPVIPQSFQCHGCGLHLNGYSELEVVRLAGRYTRTSRYSPEDYYGLEAAEPEGEYDNE